MKRPRRTERQASAFSHSIHPPHQNGKRVTSDELSHAMKEASRSNTSFDVILSELTHATDKGRYFADRPELTDAKEREASANATATMTSYFISEYAHRRIDIVTKNRSSASAPRTDALSRELLQILKMQPKARAKKVVEALVGLAGVEGSSIKAVADDGIHWIDSRGAERVTSEDALASRVSRLRQRTLSTN